ncbi:MAG: Gldg family protein, partial [Syntrophobacteraceae bacterium]
MPGQSKRRRVWTYGSNTLISSLFFLGILVFIALIAERHPWRVDLSEAGSFSLSKETINVLKTIDKPITIKAFFSTAAGDQATARDALETYRYYAGNISYEFIDPDRRP